MPGDRARHHRRAISSFVYGYWRGRLRSAGAAQKVARGPVAYVQRKHTYAAGVYARRRKGVREIERGGREGPRHVAATRGASSFCSKSPIDISRLSIADSPGVNSGGHDHRKINERSAPSRETRLVPPSSFSPAFPFATENPSEPTRSRLVRYKINLRVRAQ